MFRRLRTTLWDYESGFWTLSLPNERKFELHISWDNLDIFSSWYERPYSCRDGDFFFFFNTWLSPWGWITGPWLGYHERLSFSGWLQAKDLCNWDLENTSGHYAVCVDFHVTVDFWPCSHFHGLYAQYPSCKVPTTHSSPNQSPLICVLTSEFKKKPLSNPFRAPKSLETVPATRLAAKSKARNTVTCTN